MKNECIFCKSKDITKFITTSDRYNPKQVYTYFLCNKCHLIYLKDRTDNKEFYIYNNKKNLPTYQKFILWLYYIRIKKHFKNKGDILDFGCGSGNLSRFLKNRGYNVDCLDIDKKSLKWVKGIHKLPVYNKVPNKLYDVIILKQVFEHLPNPIKTLNEIKKHLKVGGIIVISIPNINSFQAKIFKKNWFHLDAPRHLTHFSENSFERLIRDNHLKIIDKSYLNLNMEIAGWIWSGKNRQKNVNNINLFKAGLVIPIVFLTNFLRNTAEITYIIKN